MKQIIGSLFILLVLTTAIHLVPASASDGGLSTISRNALNGGCIKSGNQWLVFGTIPSTIGATLASGGSCGTAYAYQWQSSTDNVYYTNIPGATSQNLSFSAALPQTTYFQRKTTCGNAVAYTLHVTVTMSSTVTYYNADTTGYFTRNNCPDYGVGSTVPYHVPAGTFTSTISQWDANAKARNAMLANGQTTANSGSCTWYSSAISTYYFPQNCSYGYTPEAYYVTVAANAYSSTVSKAAADSLAQQYAQGQANSYGNCLAPYPTCDYSTCYGDQYRCVYGNCELGYKIYTGSYYDSWSGQYVCVYHYEWSDGYWSGDYYENNSGGFACLMSVEQ